jgi:hypothetical protein
VRQRGLDLLGQGKQRRPKVQDHAGVLGNGGKLGEEQRNPRCRGVADIGEGVESVPQGGQRG